MASSSSMTTSIVDVASSAAPGASSATQSIISPLRNHVVHQRHSKTVGAMIFVSARSFSPFHFHFLVIIHFHGVMTDNGVGSFLDSRTIDSRLFLNSIDAINIIRDQQK
jgi:hypothetical protein